MTSVPRLGFQFCVAVCLMALHIQPANAQFWEKMTNPKITINLTHPPRLGLNLKRVAVGAASGQCADEVLDKLTSRLIPHQIEVLDRENLQATLAEQRFSMSGAVDQATAVQLGKILGPSALIFVKVTRCYAESSRTYKDRRTSQRIIRRHFATVQFHVRGTLQTVDLATGRRFVTSDFNTTRHATTESDEGMPEAPSEESVRDAAINGAAFNASTFLVPWVEQVPVYFYDDKDCNLNQAYDALKAGDIATTVRLSEESATSCKSWPKVKENNIAHAYYNAGLAYLLVNEHAKALSYLTQSQQLKPSDIATQTIAQAHKSAQLVADAQRVVEKTEAYEQKQMAQKTVEGAPAPKVSNEPIEERLRKLEGLLKKGLITKEEYEAKKTEFLKEI